MPSVPPPAPQPRSTLVDAMHAARLTPAVLATRAGVSPKTVARWMSGQALPYPHYRDLIAALVHRPAEQLWPSTARPEITAVYPTRRCLPTDLIPTLMTAATDRIDVVTRSGTHLWEHPGGVIAVIAARALAGSRVRILLTHPDSAADPTAAQRARVALDTLAPLAVIPGIEVRTHGEPLHAEIVRIDQQLLITQYVTGVTAERSPVLHLDATVYGPLAPTYLAALDHVCLHTHPVTDRPTVRHLRAVGR